MDRLLYVAMNGAAGAQLAQAVVANNLANVSTTGFRADVALFEASAVPGGGWPTRVDARLAGTAADLSAGPLVATGRELDVAVQGRGWIAVQAPDGGEAYTRAGDLRVDELGRLLTGAGHPVLGNAGPIALPPHEQLVIGADGTISVVPLGQGANALAVVDRIRLVDPDPRRLVKGPDGLLRLRDRGEAEPDAGVRLASGVLESSNVNAVEAMVQMLELARRFELQVRMMKTARENDAASAQLLRMA